MLSAACCSPAFWSSPVLIALITAFFSTAATLGGIWINGYFQKRDRAAQTDLLAGRVGEVKKIVNGERAALVSRIAELERALGQAGQAKGPA